MHLNTINKSDTLILDKTGTLTEATLEVSDIICFENYQEDQILKLAASVEQDSTHPYAQAIMNYFHKNTEQQLQQCKEI